MLGGCVYVRWGGLCGLGCAGCGNPPTVHSPCCRRQQQQVGRSGHLCPVQAVCISVSAAHGSAEFGLAGLPVLCRASHISRAVLTLVCHRWGGPVQWSHPYGRAAKVSSSITWDFPPVARKYESCMCAVQSPA